MTPRPKRLLDQVRDAIRLKHYAYSTEKTYLYWAKRFVLYHKNRHPLEMGEKEISEFLTYLAVEENVAALGRLKPREEEKALLEARLQQLRAKRERVRSLCRRNSWRTPSRDLKESSRGTAS
ncbi:MAG: hypothetical protein CEE40_10145 [Chloroflexi bacterium B3_Chlor]|nr:MAG: hypothetical protein CEE40_10145 [Chloroflexi bacterium B3_Chlor]